MQVKRLETLKGGSLGETTLIETYNGEIRVRKSVSALVNREYGVVRWHSQLKRLQRYGTLAPGLFPRILEVGEEKNTYYFDIEYFAGYINLKSHLTLNAATPTETESLVKQVLVKANSLHRVNKFHSAPGSPILYLREEGTQRLNDARANRLFDSFSNYPTVSLNGLQYPSFESQLDWLRSFVSKLKLESECFTHGNLTLENILVDPSTGDLKFIDPYDENIIDCPEADFSQILQCSSSHYGLLNDIELQINSSVIDANYFLPDPFIQFDKIFKTFILNGAGSIDEKLLDFLHMSQFLRMLPFKVQAGATNRAILFYVVACKLIYEMREKYDG